MTPLFDHQALSDTPASWAPAATFNSPPSFELPINADADDLDSCAPAALSMLVGAPYANTLADYLVRMQPMTRNNDLLKELYDSVSLNSLALPVSSTVPFTAYATAAGQIAFASLQQVKIWDQKACVTVRFSSNALQYLLADHMPCTRGILVFQYQPFSHPDGKISSHACYVELATTEEYGTCWHFSSNGEATRPVRDLDDPKNVNAKAFSEQLRYLHKAVLLAPIHLCDKLVGKLPIHASSLPGKELNHLNHYLWNFLELIQIEI